MTDVIDEFITTYGNTLQTSREQMDQIEAAIARVTSALAGAVGEARDDAESCLADLKQTLTNEHATMLRAMAQLEQAIADVHRIIAKAPDAKAKARGATMQTIMDDAVKLAERFMDASRQCDIEDSTDG
jgi:hypothetical protein